MQKKIIALAVAGLASTAAFAQTNVTIYGVLDVGQAWVKGDGNNGSPDQKTVGRLDSNSSLIGFKGVEDLGNGLKAVFQYETNFNSDTNGGLNGVRDSFVGLTGGFGTVVAGRLTHPLRAMGVKVDIMPGDAGLGTVNSLTGAIAGVKTGADDRASNAIAYVSPSFGGFSGTVAYVNGEQRRDQTVAGVSQDYDTRAWQVAAQYDNGPLFVGIGYHKTQDNVTNDPNGQMVAEDMDARVWRAAAVYTAPFGTKFSALYDNTKVEKYVALGRDIKRAAWSLGAAHPFGAHTVGLQYARANETDVSGADDLDDKATIWSALYTYSLSKRTMVHARYSRLSNDDGGNYNFYNNPVNNGAVGVTSADYSGFMVGLRHSF